MRVLFVDDDPQVLGGLRRMLRPTTRSWQLRFAESGPSALETIATETVDVVVTDMRMPGMDGAELLRELQTRHPEIVRIVLSGHTDKSMAMRSAHVAHQFLTKPCDAAHLKATIERACGLQSQLRSPALRRVVGAVTNLPSPPRVVIDLHTVLREERPSLDRIAELVASDPALSAKLLQLVNSAFFGLGQRQTSVRDAVSHLGTNVLANLVTALSAFDHIDPALVAPSFLEDEQAHALRMTSLVRDLLPDDATNHDGFVVGLLHDVGRLVLASSMPEEHRQIATLINDDGMSLSDAEREIVGTTHAEIGAYLLSLWGLPTEIIEAVVMHHRAPELPDRTMDLVHAVYIAEMIDQAGFGSARVATGTNTALDPDYLADLGVTELVASIRRPRAI